RGAETLELVRRMEAKSGGLWYLKDKQEPTGLRPADAAAVNLIVEGLSRLHTKRWVEKIDAKTDLEKFGLKAPSLTVSLTVHKERISPAAAAAVSLGGLIAVSPEAGQKLWTAFVGVLAQQIADRGETTVIQFGKD